MARPAGIPHRYVEELDVQRRAIRQGRDYQGGMSETDS
jgi:hypothetical protein